MDSRTCKASGWITERRIRAHAIILAVCIWSVVGFDFSTPGLIDRAGNIKFQDFLPFYAAGKSIIQGKASQMFDTAAMAFEMRQVVPQSRNVILPMVYGPQVALLFAPLARLSFLLAGGIWAAASFLLYFLSCYLVWRGCPSLRTHRALVLLLAIAFPPFFHFLVRGQLSSLLLLCFAAAFCAFRAGRNWLAGLALGCLIFKPPFAGAVAVILLAAGAWKALAGTAIASIAQLTASWLYFGTGVMWAYTSMLLHIRQWIGALEPGVPYVQMHSLRSFWLLLVPAPRVACALYGLSSIAVLILAVVSWKSPGPLAIRFSALLFAAVLVNPHLFVYDLAVLIPALLILSDWTLQHPAHAHTAMVRILLYLTFLLPLLGPLVILTRLQLSVPVFVGMQWMLFTILRQEGREMVGTPQIGVGS